MKFITNQSNKSLKKSRSVRGVLQFVDLTTTSRQDKREIVVPALLLSKPLLQGELQLLPSIDDYSINDYTIDTDSDTYISNSGYVSDADSSVDSSLDSNIFVSNDNMSLKRLLLNQYTILLNKE